MEKKMRARLRSVSCAFALCAVLTTVGKTTYADTATFAPSKDNTLIEDAGGASSNGAGAYFFVGKTARGTTLRSVLAFNIAFILPGSTITGATLTLYASTTQAGSIPFALHRLTQNWGEGTSASSQGPLAASTSNDATWIHTFYSSQFWTTPGGDFVVAASATQNVAFVGSYTWGSTAGMVADVQQWLDTPASNFGWILFGGENADQTAKRFESRENGTVANRPKLTVTYTPPATISGTLTLQGIAPAAPAQTISFLLHPSDNSSDSVRTVSVAPNGTFQLSNVPRKNYTIRIKGNRYLAAKINSVDASGGDVSGVMALLKAGDANNDNAADIADLLLLIAHYNKVSPNVGYFEAADFDLDGSNDISDLLLLISNYNKLGAS